MLSKRIIQKALNTACTAIIVGVFSSSSWGMDAMDNQDPQSTPILCKNSLSSQSEDLQKLLTFQRKRFLEPPELWKKGLQTDIQNTLQEMSDDPDDAHPENKKFVTYKAIESFNAVDEFCTKTLLSTNTYLLALLDIDGTLAFTGGLGYIEKCFSKPLLIHKENIFQLFLKYGFSSKAAFDTWGKDKFPVPITTLGDKYKFYDQCHMLDPNIPQMLKNWHDHKVDIFGLTSRQSFYRDHTKESLEATDLHMQTLSHTKIEENDVNLNFDQSLYSGVIYTSYQSKFGQNSAGIKFLETVLEKRFTNSSKPSKLEIIVVDDSHKVFSEIISSSNIKELQRLQEEFKTQIHINFFRPIEQHWLSLEEDVIWTKLIELGRSQRETAVFDALKDLLTTFCEPLDVPLPGPFQMN